MHVLNREGVLSPVTNSGQQIEVRGHESKEVEEGGRRSTRQAPAVYLQEEQVPRGAVFFFDFDESDVSIHLPQPPKQSSWSTDFILCLFLFLFFNRFVLIAFLGVSLLVEGEFKNTTNKFSKKNHLGSSQKMWLCFLRFFPLPRLFCSVFVYRVFGRFITRGVQKNAIKKSRFFFRSRQKKYLLTYVTFFVLF
jgi:hypothetical protein